MERSFAYVLFLSFWMLFACESDPPPDPNPEVWLRGSILHAVDQGPFANWEVKIEHRLGLRESLFTDSEGKYELRILDYRQYLLDKGQDQAEVDSMLARNDFSLEVSIINNINSCDFFSIEPGNWMRRYQSYNAMPIQELWDYHMYPSKDWFFQFQDTASSPRSFNVYGKIELRGLDQASSYATWSPLEIDLIGDRGSEFCLPIDVPVEIKYRIVEYTDGNWDNPLSDLIVFDTLTMSESGLQNYVVAY